MPKAASSDYEGATTYSRKDVQPFAGDADVLRDDFALVIRSLTSHG